jgi:UDPglucose 6-dehydrogenase
MSEILIIGAGVVGTATGEGLATRGHHVRFVDIDASRVKQLAHDGWQATETLELTGHPEIIFVALPTPALDGQYDLRALTAGVETLGRAMANSGGHHTVVLRSTVPPGTCEGLVGQLLSRAMSTSPGHRFGLASNPEFLRQKSALEDFLHPRTTLIGARSRRTRERLKDLFQPFGGQIVTVEDPAAAELAKCAQNAWNATKISFFNELWLLSRRLDVDADVIAEIVAASAEASHNPDYGIRGGYPFGGSCLVKDAEGLLGYSSSIGVPMPLLASVVKVNERIADFANRDETFRAVARADNQVIPTPARRKGDPLPDLSTGPAAKDDG